MRIHRTRHTFGRLVAEQTGRLVETQDALDHASLSMTRVYVERILIKKDKFSRGNYRAVRLPRFMCAAAEQ